MFKIGNEWQHDTLPASLYSVRGGAGNAERWRVSLAQARTDVFFTLLLGGRIVFSAGAFFDSPIAITVFGELFRAIGYGNFCQQHDWWPLLLCTDSPQRTPSPRTYLADRLDAGKGLILFREDDVTFIQDHEKLDIKEHKKKIGSAIRDGHFTKLKTLLEPFSAEYRSDELRLGREPICEPSITDGTLADSLERILKYLANEKLCVHLPKTLHRQLDKYFPLDAIRKRVDSLSNADRANELREMLNRFEAAHGKENWTHKLHEFGPSFFKWNTELINYWLDIDWHSTRHLAYKSGVLLYRSPFMSDAVQSLDPNPLVSYISDMRFSGEQGLANEKYGQLDWSILLNLVSDSDKTLTNTLWKIKQPEYKDDRKANCDTVFELLATKITDLEIQSDKNTRWVGLKQFTKPGTIIQGVAVIAEEASKHVPYLATHLPIPHAALMAFMCGNVMEIVATKRGLNQSLPFAFGVRQRSIREKIEQLQAIAPELYLPTLADQDSEDDTFGV